MSRARRSTVALARRTELASVKPLPESVREHFSNWLVGLLETSVKTYRTDLELFASWYGNSDVGEAMAGLIEIANDNFGKAEAVLFAYRKAMSEQPVWDSTAARDAGGDAMRVGLAPNTINRRLSAIRSFVKVLRTGGLTQWTPETPGVKAGKFRDTAGVGDTSVRLLVAHLQAASIDDDASESSRHKACRDLAIVCLMANMALRKSSVRSLDLRHVDEAARRVHAQLKGDARTRMWKGCDTATWSALQAWIAVRGRAHGPLFTSFCNRVDKASRISPSAINQMLIARGEELELSKRAKPHGFRHTAITRALAKGTPIEEVSRDFANHAKIATTMVYDDRRADGRDIAQRVSDYGADEPVGER